MEERIKLREPIEEMLKMVNWKDFEDFVSNIFESNDFKVKKNFRFSLGSSEIGSLNSTKPDPISSPMTRIFLGESLLSQLRMLQRVSRS